MTIIKQTGVQSSGHMKNLRGYINDDRKVILRDSLNMDGCTNLKRWAHHMWMTREAYGHNKAARRVRDKKTGELKEAKNTILFHQILGFNPDECDLNGGWLSPEECMRYANPNADTDAVEKETEKAQESAKEEKSDAKTPETSDSKKSDSGSSNGSKKDNGKTTGSSDNSGNKSNSSSKKDEGKSDSKPSGGNSSNSGSNSNSGSSSKKDDTPAHQHNWVAQTKTVHHDAQYKTVHHDAVTHQVWHDAVTEEHYICNQCGADITSDPWGHINNSLMNGGNCGSYHSTYVTVKQGYYETVTDQAAYDEQVQVRDAWDETVTTGYKCSSCGATK